MTDPLDVQEIEVAIDPVEKPVEPETPDEKPAPLLDTARRVLLASIGAVALAADEIEDFVDKLVDRGEIAKEDGRTLVKDVLERRRKLSPLDGKVDQQVERVVSRLNIPTKSDIDALNARIADLTQKIDELTRE